MVFKIKCCSDFFRKMKNLWVESFYEELCSVKSCLIVQKSIAIKRTYLLCTMSCTYFRQQQIMQILFGTYVKHLFLSPFLICM